jgi:hypothetical protein
VLRLIRLVSIALVFTWTPMAQAWLDATIRSDSVTIDVERDGKAVVAHELLVHVRGGPLKTLTVTSVDRDAEPLPDGTITRAQSGRMAGLPIPVTLDGAEGQLHAVVQLAKGLTGGTYLLRVRYRTDFKKERHLVRDGSAVQLRWNSPRFESGIDSMRVLFRSPRAETPPSLPCEGADEAMVSEDAEGVFLGTVRRGDGVDEMEIVRPHVARGEDVTWRVRAHADAFDVDLGPAVLEPLAVEAARDAFVQPAGRKDPRPWVVAGVAGMIYAALSFLKARAVADVCRRRRAEPRGVIFVQPLGLALTAGLSLASAIVVGWLTALPTLAGVLLGVSMVITTTLPPRVRVPLRGPGTWKETSPDVAFTKPRASSPWAARLFDAGYPAGFASFGLGLAAFCAGAVAMLRVSAYHAIMVALASGCLFPLFCTGRAGELPSEPLAMARRRLLPIYRALSKRGLRVVPLVRVAAYGGAADELRIRIEPSNAPIGLEGVEIWVDHHPRMGDSLTLPFVIVRVQDATAALSALPAGLLWTRGRNAEERVAVLRPRLPTKQMAIALALDTVSALSGVGPRRGSARAHSSSKPKRASGRGDSTANPRSVSSPAHAT